MIFLNKYKIKQDPFSEIKRIFFRGEKLNIEHFHQKAHDDTLVLFGNDELRKAKNICFVKIVVFFRRKGQRFLFQRK